MEQDGTLKMERIETIEIEKPIALVNELFEDIYTMKEYMPGTQDIVLTDGIDGADGARFITSVKEALENPIGFLV